MTKFKGIIPALITPLTEDGKLNKPVLKKLLEDLIAQGADGFYIGGATGEGIILSVELNKELIRESVELVGGRVPCIFHVARMNYPEMLELAKYAESVGADAVSAIPPLFYKYNDDGIFDYYKGLAESIQIPVIIYNSPFAGVTFSKDLLMRLFAIPNLTGIKWTNPNFSTVMLLKDSDADINIINGPDELLLMGLAAGCDAGIGSTYNFMLPLFKGIYNAFCAGDIKTAKELQTRTCKIIDVMIPWNVIMATKLILSKQGYDVYHPIYPTQGYTKEQEEQLLAELREAGLEL